MAKHIVLTYEGTEYTLEFDRKTVKRMEENGFVVNTDKPMTMISDLFRGAFMMHHKRITPDKVDEIWDAQRNKDKLLSELVSMYTEPIAALMDEAEGEDENPTWKVV